jgi:hypothetical protein
MDRKTMNWVHAKYTGPQSGYSAQRIVGLPRIRTTLAPAELRPLFLATSGLISVAAAIKLAPTKRSELAPELKAFIDRAIVPALVKVYLAEATAGDTLASDDVSSANRAVSCISNKGYRQR